MSELVSVSLRLPKQLSDDLDEIVEEGHYASKTEVLREALRALLYQQIDSMTGALKGKVRKDSSPLSEERKLEWDNALKKAGGNRKKALTILDNEEKKNLSGLRF